MDTFPLNGVDGTGLPDYVSGGTVYFGTFYLAKESTRMRDFTSGNSSATDHWGSTGASAMMDAIDCPLPGPDGGISRVLKIGNGINQVFGDNHTGDAGIPLSTGCSTSGTSLFGFDYYETYFRNELCVIGGGTWTGGESAGVHVKALSVNRPSSSSTVSGRAAFYPKVP